LINRLITLTGRWINLTPAASYPGDAHFIITRVKETAMNFRTIITTIMTAGALFVAVPVIAADDEAPTITEEDIEYSPEEQVVHVGQPIRIVNKDPFEHKSRVTEQTAGGGLGYIALRDHVDKPGTSYTFKLDKPGSYEIRCLLHDGMTASIKVVK